MAILVSKAEVTRNGESLAGVYIRVEPKLHKDGDKIVFELSHYANKDRYTNGYDTIRVNEVVTVNYAVSNDPYALYGLHALLVYNLTKQFEEIEGEQVEIEKSWTTYDASELAIIDIDIPA